jgi:hypothetical protein
VILVEPLWNCNYSRLIDLISFNGRSNPVHGVGRKSESSARVKLFGCSDQSLCRQEANERNAIQKSNVSRLILRSDLP